MEKTNHRKLIKTAIYLILGAIILLIASMILSKHLGAKNVPYELPLAREWMGIFYGFIVLIIVILVVMLIVLTAINTSSKIKFTQTPKIVTWVIIIISVLITGLALYLNTRKIIREIEDINERKKVPDFEYCLDCRLQRNTYLPQADEPPGNKLKFYTRDTVIKAPNQSINRILYGLKDSSVNKITKAVFRSISHSDGILLMIKEKGERFLYSYMDSTGKIIYPTNLNFGSNFKDGYAKVVPDDKFGIINKAGDFALPPVYQCIREYNNEVAIFYTGRIKGCFENGKFGAVNFMEDTIIKPSSGMLEFISPGVIRKEIPGELPKIVLYNTKGKVIRNENDTYCSSFKYRMAVVSGYKPDSYSTIIDTQEREVLDSRESAFGELIDIYVINQIVRRYNILTYDKEQHKYVFLEKPFRRSSFLKDFNYQELRGVEREYPPRNDYKAFQNYFKSMHHYGSNFEDNRIPDSTRIHVKNDTLNYQLTFYFKNNSLKYKKLPSSYE